MTFDPNRHLIKVKNNDYLEAKWRLVWLHDAHPNASIETELVSFNGDTVIVRAVVTIPTDDGHSRYTGYKTAPAKGQFPAIEKAETGAIARALAHAGFGTQFAGEDVDEGLDDGLLADSPVQRNTPRPAPQYDVRDHEPAAPANSDLASNDEIDAIGLLLQQAAMSPVDARNAVKERYRKNTRAQLTHDEAQDFMTWLRTQMPHEQPALVN
jgi:hypothetical protein